MIRLVDDQVTVVIAGAWDSRIFSPAWIAKHLALSENPEIGVSFPVSSLPLPLRYEFDGITLQVAQDKMVILASESKFGTAEKICERVLIALPHTPIAAVGVNFQFAEDDPSDKLLKAFPSEDTNDISDAGFSIRSTTIKRSTVLTKSGVAHAVNISLSQTEDDTVVFDFNFHKDTTSTEMAGSHVREIIQVYFDEAKRFMEAVYESTVT